MKTVTMATALTLAIASTAHADVWRDPISVYYNPANEAYEGAFESVKYSLWAWKQRKEIPIAIAGVGDYVGPIISSIVIEWKPIEFFLDAGLSESVLGVAGSWSYTDDGKRAQSNIFLNYSANKSDACWTNVILHEITHAIGPSYHIENDAALMARGNNYHSCFQGISELDMELVDYPDKDTCAVELTPAGHLIVPDVNGIGASLEDRLMTLVGINSYNWEVGSAYTSSGTCNVVEQLPNGDVIINKVIGYPDLELSYVKLRFVGNDTWVLEYAE